MKAINTILIVILFSNCVISQQTPSNEHSSDNTTVNNTLVNGSPVIFEASSLTTATDNGESAVYASIANVTIDDSANNTLLNGSPVITQAPSSSKKKENSADYVGLYTTSWRFSPAGLIKDLSGNIKFQHATTKSVIELRYFVGDSETSNLEYSWGLASDDSYLAVFSPAYAESSIAVPSDASFRIGSLDIKGTEVDRVNVQLHGINVGMQFSFLPYRRGKFFIDAKLHWSRKVITLNGLQNKSETFSENGSFVTGSFGYLYDFKNGERLSVVLYQRNTAGFLEKRNNFAIGLYLGGR